MNNRDWERFGEDIFRSVQDAVDTGDFSRLNQTITNAVDGAFQTLGRGMRGMGDAMNRTMGGYSYNRHHHGPRSQGSYGSDFEMPPFGNGAQWENPQGQGYSYQGYDYGESGQESRGYTYNAGSDVAYAPKTDLRLYEKTTGAKAFGIVFSGLGIASAGLFGIMFLLVLIAAFATGDFSSGFWLAAGTMASFAAAGGVFTAVGRKKLGQTRRFKCYQQVLEGREYCDVKELCAKINRAPQFVVKDLQKMITKGWFKQGRLDAQKTCLMVSNEAYEQYDNLMKQQEMQKQEEAQKAAQAKAEAENSGTDPQLREIIRRGDEYVKSIRAYNDEIPGEEISAKIYHMEMLVDRIFDRVEQNPASVKDIQKLMDYYLPTTMKLLKAYADLDAQPVQGENILSSKKEIESTLDTLNIAFEKLLDGLFQETAWDVSADASVLKTMLAQEGLTKDDFK